MLRSLLAGGVIARRRDEGEGRESEEKKKKRKNRQACPRRSTSCDVVVAYALGMVAMLKGTSTFLVPYIYTYKQGSLIFNT